MTQQTTVVNIHSDSYDVLIDRTTIFGNPFPEWQWGREECIKRFETYFYSRLERDPEFKAAVLALKGLWLGCHCAPLDCHGRILFATKTTTYFKYSVKIRGGIAR